MKSFRDRLLSTTVIPAVFGAGIAIVGGTFIVCGARAGRPAAENPAALPKAQPRPEIIELAACNPCAAKNPCGACNPCNPCNPCGAASAAVSQKCVVPRLTAAWATSPCNPCAAKNPCGAGNPCAAKNPCGACNPCAAKKACGACNPCAAKNPCGACNPCAAKKACGACNPCAAKNPCGACNPCAAKNPCGACNPCAAKNPCGACNPCAAKKACSPCNPCAAKNPCGPCNPCNPCNPCGAASAGAEITPAEAVAVYDCLKPEMTAAYAKAGVAQVAGFTGWVNVATSPYQSGTHGGRYVNNYADPHGDYRYKMYEKAGTFPLGTVLAKDSFVVRPDGKVAVGPLFVMEKMGDDFSKATGNWRYSMIMPNGQVAGRTGAKGMSMQFCADCHSSVAPDQDHVMFLPEEFRKNY